MLNPLHLVTLYAFNKTFLEQCVARQPKHLSANLFQNSQQGISCLAFDFSKIFCRRSEVVLAIDAASLDRAQGPCGCLFLEAGCRPARNHFNVVVRP
jgi:hypothetical protein